MPKVGVMEVILRKQSPRVDVTPLSRYFISIVSRATGVDFRSRDKHERLLGRRARRYVP